MWCGHFYLLQLYEVECISERDSNIQVHLEENSRILQDFFQKLDLKHLGTAK